MSEQEQLIAKLMVLNEQLWENRVLRKDIDTWLENFRGRSSDCETERAHALALLSNVMYFGERELRELLVVLFRDHYRYRVVQQVRTELHGRPDVASILGRFEKELQGTRFLGLGNPSESGTHLLYWFRQVNRLSRGAFVHPFELADRSLDDPAAGLSDPGIRRLVFIDDFCGSGDQAARTSAKLLPRLRHLADTGGAVLDISYLVLFANATGIAAVRDAGHFDCAEAVFELDDSYKAFSPAARQFKSPPAGVTQAVARHVAETYGRVISPEWPLGYKDGQLLLAFHHNTPNNSLPILWAEEPGQGKWHAIFRRYPKYYGLKQG